MEGQTESAKTEQATQQQENQAPEEGSLGNIYGFFDDEAEELAAIDKENEAEESQAADSENQEGSEESPTDETKSETSASEGEEAKETDAAKQDTKEEGKQAEEEGAEAKGETGEGEESGKEKEKEAAKPPAGFVPKEALQEERTKRQSLSQELYSAKQRLAELEGKAKTDESTQDEWKDFKVLTDQELEELWDEDPKEATLYQNRLFRYQEAQRKKQDAQREQQALERERRQIVNSAFESMNSAVPDLFEKGSDTNKVLTQYAADNGLSPQTAAILTNPETEVKTRDENGNEQSFILGHSAAEVLSLIANTHKAVKNSDPDQVRQQIENDIREKVREEVTQELTKKFKNMSGGEGDSFQSLGDATPKTEGNIETPPESEEAWMGLPEEQRRQFLGG